MVFTGPPGVGKTEVARVIGEVFRALKVLRKGHVVETDRANLVEESVGEGIRKSRDKAFARVSEVLSKHLLRWFGVDMLLCRQLAAKLEGDAP